MNSKLTFTDKWNAAYETVILLFVLLLILVLMTRECSEVGSCTYRMT